MIAAVQKHADDHAYCIGLLELVADNYSHDSGDMAIVALPADVMTEMIFQVTRLLDPRRGCAGPLRGSLVS